MIKTSFQDAIMIFFNFQGFTAAQLSTEPVGKILAEEPAAGGIDIGNGSNNQRISQKEEKKLPSPPPSQLS